ncbi:uncharacterized protein BP5553_06292 [Venustampulla echinocandica]|uniref:CCHC-type domain-containing protein n=1 Tax=Venustampulla echinocandica TaxID=2656787 RepID=A0A370TJH7_9HELO|nr:uncharacterized protein BP5553_06292 [Venustampulla echinocandica]RDL35680.1 hypothetical protein BP5553_06292 [Venustampulla echinocandica]
MEMEMEMASTEKYCRHETKEDAAAPTETDELTDNDLSVLSLKQLSRSVNLTTSPDSTLSIYLRWLEIHRQLKPNPSRPWRSTLARWVSALSSRGFCQSELANKVNIWKEQHGPFKDCARRPPPTPLDIEEAFTYLRRADWHREGKDATRHRSVQSSNQSSTKAAHKESSFKTWKATMEGSRGPPPRDYVCKRCDKKGHQLEDCPTNLDPAYDKPPDKNYTCTVCWETGKHYGVLCPYNNSRSSLTVQRKHKERRERKERHRESKASKVNARERDLTDSTGRRGQTDQEYGRLNRTPASSNVSMRDCSPPNSANRRMLAELDLAAARLLEEELADVAKMDGRGVTTFQDSSNQHRKRALPDMSNRDYSDNDLHSERKKPRKTGNTMENSGDVRPNPAEGMTMDEILSAVDDLISEERDRYAGDGRTDTETETLTSDNASVDDFQSKILARHTEEGRLRETGRKNLNPEEITVDDGEEDDRDGPVNAVAYTVTQGTMNAIKPSGRTAYRPTRRGNIETRFPIVPAPESSPAPKYSKLIQGLIKKHPEMTEVVNNVKKRPTAVDMWEADDQKKPQPGTRANLDAFESLDLTEKKLEIPKSTTPPSRTEYPQFDGACDERPNQRNKIITHSNYEEKGVRLGTVALNKVKVVTGNAKKELSALRFGRSNARSSSNEFPSFTCTAQTTPLSGPVGKVDNMKEVHPKVKRATFKLMKDGHEDTAAANIQNLQVEEVRLNANTLNMKAIYNAARAGIPASASSRSTREFQTTVRNLIDRSKGQNLERFAVNFNVPTTIPEEARSTKSQPLEEKGSFHNIIDEVSHEGKHSTAQANFIQKSKTKLMKMRVGDELKKFSRNFKLTTPIPEDIAEICKIQSRTQDCQVELEKSDGVSAVGGPGSMLAAKVLEEVDEVRDVGIMKN